MIQSNQHMKSARQHAVAEMVSYQMESSWTGRLYERMPFSQNTREDCCFY